MLLVQRVSSPPDADSRSVEWCVCERDGGLWWSVRVDAWSDVTASPWYPIEHLELVPATLERLTDMAELAPDVRVTRTGERVVRVEVTSGDGHVATATADVRGLGHAAQSLITRVREDAEFLGRLTRGEH